MLTLPEHLSSSWFFYGVNVAHFVELDVFSILVRICDISHDFCIKTMFGSSLPRTICFVVVSCLVTCVWFKLFTYAGMKHDFHIR